jgi:hypothetical protein
MRYVRIGLLWSVVFRTCDLLVVVWTVLPMLMVDRWMFVESFRIDFRSQASNNKRQEGIIPLLPLIF